MCDRPTGDAAKFYCSPAHRDWYYRKLRFENTPWSTPPTLAGSSHPAGLRRSAVRPEVLDALEADRAEGRTPKPKIELRAAWQMLAAEKAEIDGERAMSPWLRLRKES